MSRVRELLTKLGLDEETANNLLDETKSASVDVVTVAETIEAAQAEALRNNRAFLDPIERQQRAAILSQKETRMMREAGITKDEYNALGGTDAKPSEKFDLLQDLAFTRIREAASKGTLKGDEEVKRLTDLVNQLNEKVSDYETNVLPSKEKEKEAFIEAFHVDRDFGAIVTAHELVVKPEFITPAIRSQLAEKYDLKRVDGSLVLKQKGTDLDAFDGTRKLTPQDVVKQALETAGALKKSGGTPNPSPTPTPTPEPSTPKTGRRQLPGIAAAEERSKQLAEMKPTH